MAIEITQWCNEANENVGSLGEFDTMREALVHFHSVIDLQPTRVILLMTGFWRAAPNIEIELDAHEPQVGDTVESFIKDRLGGCGSNFRWLADGCSREETARQAGMVFGCQGYNDVMGY